jgi:hypothetical protein
LVIPAYARTGSRGGESRRAARSWFLASNDEPARNHNGSDCRPSDSRPDSPHSTSRSVRSSGRSARALAGTTATTFSAFPPIGGVSLWGPAAPAIPLWSPAAIPTMQKGPERSARRAFRHSSLFCISSHTAFRGKCQPLALIFIYLAKAVSARHAQTCSPSPKSTSSQINRLIAICPGLPTSATTSCKSM